MNDLDIVLKFKLSDFCISSSFVKFCSSFSSISESHKQFATIKS